MSVNATIVVASAGAAVAGAGLVVGVAAPTDWAGVAQVITACGVLLTSFGTLITGIMVARQKKDVEAVKAVVSGVAVAVDGGMKKLLDAKVGEATAQATLDEKSAQRERQGIEDAATLKEQQRVASSAPPAPAAHPEPIEVELKKGPGKDSALRVKHDDKT